MYARRCDPGRTAIGQLFPLSQSAVATTDRPVGRDQFPGTTTQLFAKKVLSLETTNELSPNLRT